MSIPSTLKPITLEGDLLALSDDLGETIIFNWKTSASATLQHVLDGQGIWQVRYVLTRGRSLTNDPLYPV